MRIPRNTGQADEEDVSRPRPHPHPSTNNNNTMNNNLSSSSSSQTTPMDAPSVNSQEIGMDSAETQLAVQAQLWADATRERRMSRMNVVVAGQEEETPASNTSTATAAAAATTTTTAASTNNNNTCLLYTSPSPRDLSTSRMPSSA